MKGHGGPPHPVGSSHKAEPEVGRGCGERERERENTDTVKEDEEETRRLADKQEGTKQKRRKRLKVR